MVDKSRYDEDAISLAEIIKIAARATASSASAEWCQSIGVPRSFFDRTIPKARSRCHLPCRVEKPGELVRVDWYPADRSPDLLEFSNRVVLAVGPFIEGVGYVLAENDEEGRIVVLRDNREDFGIVGHGFN
jgi:hypothetical protein